MVHEEKIEKDEHTLEHDAKLMQELPISAPQIFNPHFLSDEKRTSRLQENIKSTERRASSILASGKVSKARRLVM